MRRISDFGESAFFIILGLIGVFAFRNPEELGHNNTIIVIGQLSDFPKDGIHDESDDYIGLWISGHKNFYEFSNCSHTDAIEEKVRKLGPGDSVTLYVEKTGVYTTYPWSGDKYKTHRICDAYSNKLGRIITFNQYNNCKEFKANTYLPILGFIIIFMGVSQFVKTFNSKENLMDTKYLNIPEAIGGAKNEYIKLKPDMRSYIIRNSGLPIIMIIVGFLIRCSRKVAMHRKWQLGMHSFWQQ